MSRKSRRWLHSREADHWVQQAKESGYRSRAAFKLLEMDRRERLLVPGLLVVDLGAAPGSWSQAAAKRVGPKGRVVALDRLPMEPIDGVHFIQADFTEDGTAEAVLHALEGRQAALLLSDMAPNLSGIAARDQAAAAQLCTLAMAFAEGALAPGGRLLMKAFHGEEFEAVDAEFRRRFRHRRAVKPDASRAASRELYLLGEKA